MTTDLNKSPPQHTALPWHYDHQTKEVYIPDDENEPCDVIADMETFKNPIDKAHANGEFIVRACNSHYELLEACEEFVRKVDAGQARSTLSYQQMKSAIAKARGQK